MNKTASSYVSTTNACKLCKPLGACLAFRGIEGAVPFLHGSQGCATYMRRYIISHFREPMDIASSSLGEKHAIYGGGQQDAAHIFRRQKIGRRQAKHDDEDDQAAKGQKSLERIGPNLKRSLSGRCFHVRRLPTL